MYAIADGEVHNPPEQLLRTLSALNPIVKLCLLNTKLSQGDYVTSLLGSKAFNGMMGKLAKVMGWRLELVAGPNEGGEDMLPNLVWNLTRYAL